MTKTAVVSDKEIADAARSFFRLLAIQSPTIAKVAEKAAVAAVEDADDADDEEVEGEPLDRDETIALSIKELRSLAKEYGVGATKKAEILEGLEEFFTDSDDEDEEDDEDEGDEDDELTRDKLEEMDLKELRLAAKEAGHTSSEYRGMDQDALVDLILGEDEADEDEEDDEEGDDEEEEEEELDEDALNAMSLTELRSLAKEIGVKVAIPATVKTETKKKAVYVKKILDSAEE